MNAESEAKPNPKKPAQQRFQGLDSNLTFRRLRAEGPVVLLQSIANDLTARMTDLVYDAQTKVAQLRDDQQVRVLQGASEIRCPEIKLLHDDDGTMTSVWCLGVGWLKSYDELNGELQLAAEWTKKLRKYPDPDDPNCSDKPI